jgi:hypothetical protein
MSRLLLGFFGFCLAVFLAGAPAGAAVFTIDAAVPVTVSGNSVSFDPVNTMDVGDLTDSICFSSGTTCTETFATNDWVVFTLSVAAGSVIDSFGFGGSPVFDGGFPAIGPMASNNGYFNSSADGLTYAGIMGLPSTVPEWQITNGGGVLTGAVTTLTLFAMYDLNTLPQTPNCPFAPTCGPDPVGTVNFMVSSGVPSITGSAVLTSVTVLPEPSTAFLMGLGVVFISACGRRSGA